MPEPKKTDAQTPNDAPPSQPESKPADNPPVSEPPKTTQASAPSPAENELTRLAQLEAAFASDPAFVLEQFKAGRTAADAQVEFLRRENEQLKTRLASVEARTGAPPAPFTATGAEKSGTPDEFMALARERAEQKKIPLYRAMSEITHERPDLPTH